MLVFVFKDFPIGLNENLREEDNLSTRDKWPVPNVSFVRRFYCTLYLMHIATFRGKGFEELTITDSIRIKVLILVLFIKFKYRAFSFCLVAER